MHRWNNALDQAGIGEYETVVGPCTAVRAPRVDGAGHFSGSVPGLY